MRLKQAQRAAAVAWGPTPQTSSLLASGTVAGSVDGSFSCTGTFEILDVGLSDSAAEVTPLGTAESAEKFYSVAWGSLGADGAHPWGVVAGGLADGSVNLWDANAVANGNASTLSATKQHDGPVFSLEWNHTLPNLLASGAGDGATYIWDFTSPSAPAVFSPGPNKASAVGDITCVAWNRKVRTPVVYSFAGCANLFLGRWSTSWPLSQQLAHVLCGISSRNAQSLASVTQRVAWFRRVFHGLRSIR